MGVTTAVATARSHLILTRLITPNPALPPSRGKGEEPNFAAIFG